MALPIHGCREGALYAWGFECRVGLIPHSGLALCLEPSASPHGVRYIYHKDDATNPENIFFMSSERLLTSLEHMKGLYAFGFCKAVVLDSSEIATDIWEIRFVEPQAAYAPQVRPQRPSTPWPAPQPTKQEVNQIISPETISTEIPSSRIGLSIPTADIEAFLTSADSVLQRDLLDLEVPTEIQAQIGLHGELGHIDRLLIFTDGSPSGKDRFAPPEWIAQNGTPDSWAFAVFAEEYLPDGTSNIAFLGWAAQQVLYEPHLPHFAGTAAIGSSPAETVALLWAGLWRPAQNHDIPAVFLSDFETTVQQALGNFGSTDFTEPFQLLRATFQALESALPHDGLQLHHVRGHTGFALNELVDIAAKAESHTSRLLPRQDIDLRVWKHRIPYMWMIVSPTPDMPQFTASGFDVGPIGLPDRTRGDQVAEAPKTKAIYQVEHYISLASANVCSLYTGPDGHAGKLGYFRDQFHALGLNFLGIQEARPHAGMSCAGEVLRPSSGHHQGALGVELWISLRQPIGYLNNKPLMIRRNHVSVLRATPRTLITKIERPQFRFAIVVGHAPHCGHPEDVRNDWRQTEQLAGWPLFLLIDANALSGAKDDYHVLGRDADVNANTPHLRYFLRLRDLFLPSAGEHHIGLDATWTSPSGLHTSRIDYVGIPITLKEACARSTVLEDFDLGQLHDHRCVAVQIQWKTSSTPMSAPRPHCGVHYDRQAIQASLHTHLCNWTGPTWDCDIETHVEGINGHLLQAFAKHCPLSKNKPKKPYIDDSIWDCRSRKIQARRTLKHLRGQARKCLLRTIFTAWRDDQRKSHIGGIDALPTLRCQQLRHYATFRHCAKQLCSKLRKARSAYLASQLQHLSAEAPASQILQTYKAAIGPTNPKKWKSNPLPVIRDAEGQVCDSAQAAEDRWIEFFGNMEGGKRVSADAQRAFWLDDLEAFQVATQTIDPTELPSLVDLEGPFVECQQKGPPA